MPNYKNKRRFGDNRNNMQQPEHLESRISSVETAVSHIEISMDDIKTSIHNGFQEVRRDIDRQADTARPKVVQWAGWAAVMLIVIGMFGSGYVRDLNRAEENINSLGLAMFEHYPDYAAAKAEIMTRLDLVQKLSLKMHNELDDFTKLSLANEAKDAERLAALEREVFTQVVKIKYSNNPRPSEARIQ